MKFQRSLGFSACAEAGISFRVGPGSLIGLNSSVYPSFQFLDLGTHSIKFLYSNVFGSFYTSDISVVSVRFPQICPCFPITCQSFFCSNGNMMALREHDSARFFPSGVKYRSAVIYGVLYLPGKINKSVANNHITA